MQEVSIAFYLGWDIFITKILPKKTNFKSQVQSFAQRLPSQGFYLNVAPANYLK
jgi:uncharacterized protein YcgL (UPF0745 family)